MPSCTHPHSLTTWDPHSRHVTQNFTFNSRIVPYFQVIVGTGCLTHSAYALDYGGVFDCQAALIATIVCVVAVLFILVIVIACVVRRRRQQRDALPPATVNPGYMRPGTKSGTRQVSGTTTRGRFETSGMS